MRIEGAELLTSVFGDWPSFHDVEVVRRELVRVDPFAEGPELLVDVHAFEVCSESAWGGSSEFLCRSVVIESVRPWEMRLR